MDKNRELERFTFILNRDGLEQCLEYTVRMIAVYRQACKNGRKKQGRHFAYRREFIEAIYSFRHLLKGNK